LASISETGKTLNIVDRPRKKWPTLIRTEITRLIHEHSRNRSGRLHRSWNFGRSHGSGEGVVGIDNFNDYYAVTLKRDRVADLRTRFQKNFTFLDVDFSNFASLADALRQHRFSTVVHMGAQPGVRYSLENPHAYVRSNVVGHLNILEFCRHAEGCDHLIYASSSSVYGGNEKCRLRLAIVPTVGLALRSDETGRRASKRELFPLYRLPQTGLRFFTGLWPVGQAGHDAMDFH